MRIPATFPSLPEQRHISATLDDGSQALFTIVLIATVVIIVKLFGMPPFWGALLLVAGCFTILGESVFRAARGR